jgi:regulatory protein
MPLSAKPKKPRQPLEAPALLEYAVRSLASKMKSERDLRRRMRERAAPDEEGAAAVEAVVIKLKSLGYLSDERFAADYTRLRQENEKLGRRRVQQGLFQKGIPAALANKSLAAAYDDVDELALVRQYIERKRMKPPGAPDRETRQKETAKVMRRLLTAGFSSRTVWKVLREWEPELAESDIDVSGDVPDDV